MVASTIEKPTNQRGDEGDDLNIPRPDPSVLTTQQLEREVSWLRDILTAEAKGQKEVFEARLAAMDKAVELLQVTARAQPALVDDKIGHLRTLHEEKFQSIQTQFKERDVRTEQLSVASKVAVDAALQAAKELGNEQNKSAAAAIAKSEGATVKQIEQIGVLITTTKSGADDKIDDLKARMTRVESEGKGGKDVKDESRATTNMLIGAVGLVIAIGLAVVGFRSGGQSSSNGSASPGYTPPGYTLVPIQPAQVPIK